MAFRTFTEEEFESWARESLVDFEIALPKMGKELVIRHDTKIGGLEIHIYTSLTRQAGQTRDKGEDAIRCILYDRNAGKIVTSAKKILRTEGATTIWSRLNERVAELMQAANEFRVSNRFCTKCGSHTVTRINRRTQEEFQGCAAYPKCGDKQYVRHKYPLQYNPWPTLPDEPPIPSEPVQQPTVSMTEMIIPPVEVEPVIPTIEGVIDIVDEDKVSPAAEYPFIQYSFEQFNRVQSAVFQHRLWEKDCNLVLGTTTSSGKTITAELAMGHTLAQGQKVIYVSPLKSLTQEKFDEWKVKFAQYNIEIMTGDYTMNDRRASQLMQADIICLTSEMVDSRTRNYQSEKSQWMYKVGLVIVDETHIISTNRGHAVEAGLMRFTRLVPSARMWLLSATMPNVGDFRQWLTNANGKQTEVINSAWRPTQLDWHFVNHMIIGNYQEIQADKRKKALEVVSAKPDEKYLVFVHDKTMGRALSRMFTEAGVENQFHNADLGLEDRLEIERSFADRQNGLRVLISTSTLAWGRTLPARNVVIVGTTRGIEEVDELDFIQMAGRAGRFGVDPKGDCYFVMDNKSRWMDVIANPRSVTSTLLDEGILGFHILAEVKNGEIYDKATLDKWFDRSLAKIQAPVDSELVDKVLIQLQNWGMLIVDERGYYKITRLGRVSATLYFLPQDVAHWATHFNEMDMQGLWESDLALSYALGTTPSMMMDYVPRSEVERVQEYVDGVREIWRGRVQMSVLAADLHDLLTGEGGSPATRGMQADIDRITEALVWIDGIKNWQRKDFWKALPIRIKYGVSQELVELCGLPGIGAVRAKKLHAAGITSVREVLQHREAVEEVVGSKTASKVFQAARGQLRIKQLETDAEDEA